MRVPALSFNRHIIKETRLARGWSIEGLAAESLAAVCRALDLDLEECFDEVPA